jgi:hypothetical protein
MLKVSKNSEIVNLLANDPSIYPFIAGAREGKIDLTEQVSNPNNVVLMGEFGCVLMYKQQHGIYEFHTMVLPEGRGGWTLRGAKFAFNYMFTHTDAFELMTLCPDGNLPAKSLCKLLGMTKQYRTQPRFKFEGKFVSCDVYSFLLQDWAITDEFITKSGEWFHEHLESEYKRLGKNIEAHEVDDIHNRYVGATVEMLRNGLIVKAIAFFNRFAYTAWYSPISLVSKEPLVIDIHDSKLLVRGSSFEVIPCQPEAQT